MDLSSRVRVCQDADGSGTIDCDEFDQTFVLKAKFAEIDTDGSGELDANELATLFESMGKPVSVRAQPLMADDFGACAGMLG